jgi:hypothetical protein
MTIILKLAQAQNLAQLSNMVFRALDPIEPNFAREAATAVCQASDLNDGIQAVLKLRTDLRVEWEEAK